MEIEKKFLLLSLPENLEEYHKKEIEQAYLNRRPVLRVRKSNDDYYFTYKGIPEKSVDSDTTICNVEIEGPLTKEAYEHLRDKADGHVIYKTRYVIPIGTCRQNCPGVSEEIRPGEDKSDAESLLNIELDMFHGRLEGLVYAEIEFPSVDAAERFVKPDWFGEDVSMDKHYRNGYLSEQ